MEENMLELEMPEIQNTDTGIALINDNSPLAARMRPQELKDFYGQTEILQPGMPLRNLIEGNLKNTNSVFLYGPAGTGKTTIAHLIAKGNNDAIFIEQSAVEVGVKEIREIIKDAKIRFKQGKQTILFLDEIHRFNKAQQDILLPAVENKWILLIAATTENPVFSINAALLSRSLLIKLESLKEKDLKSIIKNTIKKENIKINEDAISALIESSTGDARRILTILEAAASHSRGKEITVNNIEKVSENIIKWGADDHYDVASAFIKSMRGSDPDATEHYLARMIKAGEDPRFIARRIMIAASEDVGLADSTVLTTAVSAAQAVQLVGMPEARIILSHAALAVALAPKSNSAYLAIDKALDKVEKNNLPPVPVHLKDTHKADSDTVGYQKEYQYPHDADNGINKQKYLPEKWINDVYYNPKSIGREKALKERLEKINKYRNS